MKGTTVDTAHHASPPSYGSAGPQAAHAGHDGHDGAHAQGHIVPYKTFVIVWLFLVAFTVSLVVVSKAGQFWAVAALLTLTPLKAGLVLYFFMHLKYEPPLFKGMVFAAVGTLIIFIGLLFADILYR